MPEPMLTDGDFFSITEVEGRLKSYPFLNGQVKDVTSYLNRRPYQIHRSAYVPAAALSQDPDDSSAYLVDESDPEYLDCEEIRVWRTYAKIPGDQVSYDLWPDFVRQPLHDLALAGGLGTVWAVSFDDLATSTLFFNRTAASLGGVDVPKDVTGATAGALPAATVTIGKNAGGTFTFSTSDSGSTIQAAFASAFGSSSYVSRSDRGISVTGASLAIKYVDVSGTGISTQLRGSIATDQELDISIDLGNANAASVRRVTVTLTMAVGQLMALWNGDKLVATGKIVATNTTTYADLELAEVPGKDLVITAAALAASGLRLVNGPRDSRIKVTDRFYLQGVTTGVTTGRDVPDVRLYTSPIAWFGRIIATTHTGVTGTNATGRLGKTAHGMVTGDTFFILDKGTGLSGVSTLTQYWAIRVDADNWQVATSRENALAGTAASLGSDATGAKVLVPAPLAAVAVSRVTSWRGPIVTRRIEEVLLASALETDTASA